MTAIRVVSGLLTLVMLVSILVGLIVGGFTDDGSVLLDLTWGRITLVDIYAAFTIAWLWIAWRENSPARAVLWAVLVATLGSLAIAGYVFRASLAAPDVPTLLLGPHRPAPVG